MLKNPRRETAQPGLTFPHLGGHGGYGCRELDHPEPWNPGWGLKTLRVCPTHTLINLLPHRVDAGKPSSFRAGAGVVYGLQGRLRRGPSELHQDHWPGACGVHRPPV